jgi:hypothetical protein
MAYWLVREKRAPGVIVVLLEKATRPPKTADPPSPRLRRASWRPPLLVARQAQRATFLRALLERPACPP